jgi:hypothetical protein
VDRGRRREHVLADSAGPAGTIRESIAGTVYVTGAGGGDAYYATVAYNATTGTQVWGKHYTGSEGGGATWAAVSPTTGTVYVTGFTSGSGTGNDYATVAYQG